MTMNRRVGKCTVAVLYFMYIGLCYPILAIEKRGELGETANLNCTVHPETKEVQWFFNFSDEPIKLDERIKENTQEGTEIITNGEGESQHQKISTLTIANLTADDAGNYTCQPMFEEGLGLGDTTNFDLKLSFPVKLVSNLTTIGPGPIKVNVTDETNITMICVFEVYRLGEVRWYKKGNEDYETDTKPKKIGFKSIQTSLPLVIDQTESNGTYVCEVFDHETASNASGSIDVIVFAKPKLLINEVIPISPTQLYFSWTLWTHNRKIKTLSIMLQGPQSSVYDIITIYPEKINESDTSYVLNGLNKSTTYGVGMLVITIGEDKVVYKNVTTLDKEPTFIPQISINGFSATSVTIGWEGPSPDIEKFIHSYELIARKKDHDHEMKKAFTVSEGRNIPYMFSGLDPHTTYVFKVKACSFYTNECGNWSQEMEAATLDGKPGEPANVTSYCEVNFMNLTWNPPQQPNAEIKGYIMELTGYAKYIDRYGNEKEDTWGPLSKFMTNNSRSVRFEELQPNTVYNVQLSAMTRTRRRGHAAAATCTTHPARPDAPPRPRWRKILDNDKYMFKLYLPRISERNGPICCYRVYMVHLPPNTRAPSPKDIKVLDYEKAHASNEPAAYLTDMFTNDNYPNEDDLIMGDNKTVYNRGIERLKSAACRVCLERPSHVAVTTTTSPEPPTTNDMNFENFFTTADPIPPPNPRVRRHYENDYANDRMMMDTAENIKENKDIFHPVDGPLDPNSNYTLFVELIVNIPEYEPIYSTCVNPLMAAPNPSVAVPSTTLEIALQVTCALAALVLVGMVAFCVLQTRRTRKMHQHHHHHGHEMSTLQTVFKYVTGRGKQQTVSSLPPDLPPIPREDLADAYAERQVDSDYGFQKEFELLQVLPECYPDRTTHASEARENQPKNRYPDIKAYDQTRVKLSQIDSITGSDYINANYVRGYTDPKKFICAQGPTDTTVNDFWRMIWEHGLELIVMLTNLEEYSKVKCSKYWPDEVRGARVFGAITVHHVSEKRYSDYIVRELRITKQPTNVDGQLIVENNGIAKRNGDCKEPSESSAPTSPRELKESSETRIVRQYHFLMWKDFAAPEHPYSILKFIKRVNEASCNMMGRPVVVHCSAGVGRTGTLVALDCLLDQLEATGHAAVFNTVADLRRQRNFLVQSLKQYVFVYRALVEWAHYGDTEIPAPRLKTQVDRLRNTPEGADKCLMEHQFDKILNSPVAEPLKSCAAGAGEELRSRNRSGDCLPYDRNRVILTPIPGRDYSTYINASFIEAYDNSEGFIITQDPLPNTIVDFWRMVAEHNVSTIVMLSELGDGKCPRYWEDNTAQYDHIGVQYEESESCPYYTRRQFRITNNKSGEVICVRQLQYQGWPTAPGHVPEVTRGLAELADAALPHVGAVSPHAASHGTMLVHCQFGTERSSLFVALCVLISQLRVERRVDVCCVARKVRYQRANTIDTFLQYEFLHRAILNYAELHNLLEDS